MKPETERPLKNLTGCTYLLISFHKNFETSDLPKFTQDLNSVPYVC